MENVTSTSPNLSQKQKGKHCNGSFIMVACAVLTSSDGQTAQQVLRARKQFPVRFRVFVFVVFCGGPGAGILRQLVSRPRPAWARSHRTSGAGVGF